MSMYREALRQQLAARLPRLPGHFEKRQIAFVLRGAAYDAQKNPHTRAARHAGPRQKYPAHRKVNHNFTEAWLKTRSESGMRSKWGPRQRRDGAASHVPEHRNLCVHVVLCDIMFHEHTLGDVRQHHLCINSGHRLARAGTHARSARRSWPRRARVDPRRRRARTGWLFFFHLSC